MQTQVHAPDGLRYRKKNLMIDPIAISIAEAGRMAGLGRTSIYAAIQRGQLKTRHFGRRTLIEVDSIRAFLASLPETKSA